MKAKAVTVLAVAAFCVVSSFAIAQTGTVTVRTAGSDGCIFVVGDPTPYYEGDSFTRPAGTRITYVPKDATQKIPGTAGSYTVIAGDQELTVTFCNMSVDLGNTGGSVKLTQTGEIFVDGQAK